MKKLIYIFLVICSIILIGNYLDRFSIKVYDYSSQDSTFKFTVVKSKGRTMEMMSDKFQEWKAQKESRHNQVLHRNFKKNYLMFWKWHEYNSHYYNYPFMERK